MPRYKTAAQLVLLLSAIAMILLGIRLGEAETVLSKAIRLCMECVGIPAPVQPARVRLARFKR